MKLCSLSLVALASSLAACDPPAATTRAVNTPDASAPAAPVAPAPTSKAAPPTFVSTAKTPTTAELASVANGTNAFALDVYAKARSQKGNLAMSPFSIATALAMTAAGARGETADQMRKVLHLPADADRSIDVLGSLQSSYGAPDQKVTIRVANRLFGDSAYAFEAPYLDRVKSVFGAPLEPVDFVHGAEAARGRINGWVAEQTEGRIQNLIPPNGVNDSTRLVLANAIYFLGDWAQPFEKAATRDAPFSVSRSESKPAPTMHATEGLSFGTAPGVKLLELPYQNGALGMTLVLPDDVDGVDALEARLTPELVDGWVKRLTAQRVAVSLPKFTIEAREALALRSILQGLGMTAAFDGGQADFAAIAKPRNGERLFLGSVVHKAFVRVDEKGTEAAAATAVGMAAASLLAAKPAEFKADHPFLFLLRDLRSGMILFMGRVADPTSK